MPSTEITNAASFEARRTQTGEPVRTVGWESVLVEQPPVPPTATPTPEPPLPEIPAEETPVPARPVPGRLAETGAEESAPSFAATAAVLLAAGWAALAVHARRARGRA